MKLFLSKPKTGIKRLQVLLEHSNQMENLIWEYASNVEFWQEGQVLIEKGMNFKVRGAIEYHLPL